MHISIRQLLLGNKTHLRVRIRAQAADYTPLARLRICGLPRSTHIAALLYVCLDAGCQLSKVAAYETTTTSIS